MPPEISTISKEDQMPRKREYYDESENEENRKECHFMIKSGGLMCKELCSLQDITDFHPFEFIPTVHRVSEQCFHICELIGVPTEKICPLNSGCPDGCPCPSYECGPNYDAECGQADPSLNWFSLDIELEDGTTAKKCFAFINEKEATQYAE